MANHMHRDISGSLGTRVSRVTDTIFVIQGNNRARSPFSNAVCILDRTSLLMDSGCGLDIIRRAGSALKIDSVVLSHSHPDHTSGTWLLQEICGSEISVPRQGSGSIAAADRLASRFVSSDLTALWKETYLPLTGFRDFSFTAEYGEGSEFSTGENRFIAIHTPGHLQDHYCMWEPDRKILVGFDIDLSPFGPWYGNPESDIIRFERSLELIMRLPVETYISSHARPVKPPHFMKRLKAYASVLHARDESILSLIPQDSWIGVEEIVERSPIYGIDYRLHPDRILKFGEEQMVAKHIRRLVVMGRVTEDGYGKYRQASR